MLLCGFTLPYLFVFEGPYCLVSVAVSLDQTSMYDHAVTLLDQVQYCGVAAAVLTEVLFSVCVHET